jgi:hypothetical protein
MLSLQQCGQILSFGQSHLAHRTSASKIPLVSLGRLYCKNLGLNRISTVIPRRFPFGRLGMAKSFACACGAPALPPKGTGEGARSLFLFSPCEAGSRRVTVAKAPGALVRGLLYRPFRSSIAYSGARAMSSSAIAAIKARIESNSWSASANSLPPDLLSTSTTPSTLPRAISGTHTMDCV